MNGNFWKPPRKEIEAFGRDLKETETPQSGAFGLRSRSGQSATKAPKSPLALTKWMNNGSCPSGVNTAQITAIYSKIVAAPSPPGPGESKMAPQPLEKAQNRIENGVAPHACVWNPACSTRIRVSTASSPMPWAVLAKPPSRASKPMATRT